MQCRVGEADRSGTILAYVLLEAGKKNYTIAEADLLLEDSKGQSYRTLGHMVLTSQLLDMARKSGSKKLKRVLQLVDEIRSKLP